MYIKILYKTIFSSSYPFGYRYTELQDIDVNDHVAICKNIVKNQLKFPPGCSDSPCAKMIKGLLTTQPHMRLGCMAGGAVDIKSHMFYKGWFIVFFDCFKYNRGF
jgi:hypothetical protein